MQNNETNNIIEFYMGYCADCENRMISEIWSWDFASLENSHNFIQWLFPLNEESHYNYYAPILEANQIQTFRNSSELKSNLLISLKTMFRFYGFDCITMGNSSIIIKRTDNFNDIKMNWLNQNNHNYLRITRILKCLKLLGLEEYAFAFYRCLEEIYADEKSKIGEVAFNYWKNVVI